MKHLKLYTEGFKKSDYYIDLGRMNTNDDHEKLRELYYKSYDCNPVSEDDVKVISDLLKGEWESIYADRKEQKYNDRKEIGGYWIKYNTQTCMPFTSSGTHPWIWYRTDHFKSNIKFEIFALPDEYFLVLERVKTFRSGDGVNNYYKCDQLEGLIELLKDKKILK